MVSVWNRGHEPFKIEVGDRIALLVFVASRTSGIQYCPVNYRN